jgi:hypothetical protein
MLSIVSLMKEEFEDVAHFVRYHLGLGITDILIFYDGEDTKDLQAYLEMHLNCGGYSIISLSEVAEVQPYLGPPKVFETIQNAVHQLACRNARNPWLITLDADEFLFGPSLDAAALSAVPEQILSVRFPVAEAVWLPGDDPWCPYGSRGFRTPFRFRRPKRLPSIFRKLLPRIVYRRDEDLFPDNVIGHGQGRHMFRKDAQFDYIGPHHAEIGGRDVSVSVAQWPPVLDKVKVLHYDAISFERWSKKIRRRVNGQILSQHMRPERRKMLEEFLACNADTDVITLRNQKDLFLRLYCLNWRQYLLLKLFRSGYRALPFGSRDI